MGPARKYAIEPALSAARATLCVLKPSIQWRRMAPAKTATALTHACCDARDNKRVRRNRRASSSLCAHQLEEEECRRRHQCGEILSVGKLVLVFEDRH